MDIISSLQEKEQVFKTYELASYLKREFEKAKSAKISIDNILVECLRRKRSEYTPQKLAQMRQLFGPNYEPPFVPITLTKCVAAEAWINDLLFSSGQPPYEITTTPEPELEEDEILEITDEILQKEVENAIAMGITDPNSILQEVLPKIKYAIKSKIDQRVEQQLKPIKRKIEDILVEGGWYKALKEVVSDIVTFKCGILKGPIYKSVKRLTKEGKIEEKVIPTFIRVSPFDIFPEPDSSSIDDGYIFERVTYTKKELAKFRNLDGINKNELEIILDKYSDNFYSIPLPIDTEREVLEFKEMSYSASNKIDCLEFWGSVDGKKLIEWNNGDTLIGGNVIDPLEYYDICAWIIDDHVIRVILNPDPLGKKPYYKTSWIEIQDSFWGQGIPEIVADLQDACNSIARNMLLNAAFCSGPISEVNIDRLAEGETSNIHPYKTIEVTSKNMMESPVVRFNQAQLVADRLIMVYRHFSQLADEITIPAYAHGDQNVGGAARTSSGLAMLFRGATKNIRNVLDNIDTHIIEPSIQSVYSYGLIFNEFEAVPDIQIIAKGSAILMLREQRSRDLMEFLALFASPELGQEIDKRALIEAIVESKGFDVSKILKDPIEKVMEQQQMMKQNLNYEALKNNPMAYNITTGGSLPKQPEQDEAGNTTSGGDFRE